MHNPFEGPVSESERAVRADLDMLSVLFGFEGRIPRRTYWGCLLLSGVALALAMVVPIYIGAMLDNAFGAGTGAPMLLVMPLAYFAWIWCSLAVEVKRWHDRGYSGWMVLIRLIPVIGPLWAFVEVGCLRGVEGPNEYGPDPT